MVLGVFNFSLLRNNFEKDVPVSWSNIFNTFPLGKKQLRTELQNRDTELAKQKIDLNTVLTEQDSARAKLQAELVVAQSEVARLREEVQPLNILRRPSLGFQNHDPNGLSMQVARMQISAALRKVVIARLMLTLESAPSADQVAQLAQRESRLLLNSRDFLRREELLNQRDTKLLSREKQLALSAADLQKREDVLAQSQRNLEHEISQAEAGMTATNLLLNTDLKSIKDQKIKIENTLKKVKQDLDIAEAEIRHLNNGNGKVLWTLKAKLAQISNEVEWLNGEKKTWTHDNEKLKMEADATNLKLQPLEQEINSCHEEISRLKLRIADTKNVQKLLESKKSEMILLTEKRDCEIQPGQHIQNQSTLQNKKILEWIFSEAAPENRQVEHGYIYLIGEGPWDEHTFDKLMEDQKFYLCSLPHEAIEHIVVGRRNWQPEVLEQQIAARQGLGLRIYSQEMWFVKLTTGRDPFDTDDLDLLLSFAKGHDALEYLIQHEFDWPEVSINETASVNAPLDDFGVKKSPMHFLGYQVGRTSPHSEKERQDILTECFFTKKLPFGLDSSDAYRSYWGAAKSPQRIYRMALHIKSMFEGRNGKSPGREIAQKQWRSDFDWLKSSYYKRGVHTFKWPNL